MVYIKVSDKISRYIHGGAWRDPRVSASTFTPAMTLLNNDTSVKKQIAGFASINYRLSPHPDFPAKPGSPVYRHPDHIHDVLSALALLQKEFNFGERYILAGHSCGATLAFQVAMNHWNQSSNIDIPLPQSIIGLEGIYDILSLLEHHQHPMYRQFITGAFGPSQESWKEVSPAFVDYSDRWPGGQLAVLAHSPDDTLVEKGQMSRMVDGLRSWERDDKENRRDVQVLWVEGEHNVPWEKGEGVAYTIRVALEVLEEIREGKGSASGN